MAQAQGIALVTLLPGQQSLVDNLAITANAKTLISQELASGMIVITPVQSIQIDGVDRLGWYEVDPQTGQSIGVLDDGTHGFVQAIASNLFSLIVTHQAEFFYGVLVGWSVDRFLGFVVEMTETAFEKTLPKQVKKAKALADVLLIYGWAQQTEARLYLTLPAFAIGMALGLSWGLKLAHLDPPVTPALRIRAPRPSPAVTRLRRRSWNRLRWRAVQSQPCSSRPAQAIGTIQGIGARRAARAGSSPAHRARPVAEVRNAGGSTVGSGAVSLAAASPTALSISGSATYSVSGTGSLSFYGPAGNSLGVSGDWTELLRDRHRQRLDHAHHRRPHAQRPGAPRRDLHDHDQSAPR